LIGWYEGEKQIHIHLAGRLSNGNWQAYSWTSGLEVGKRISFGKGKLTGKLVSDIEKSKVWEIIFDQENVIDLLDTVARPIMSPYVKKEYAIEYYQNFYADIPGSSELPAAGRHFTEQTLTQLKNKGVLVEYITLHTGLSSVEISQKNFEDHRMHEEQIEVSQETADVLNNVRRQGKRIFGVGTTVVRTLETVSDDNCRIHPYCGYSNLYIYPGYRFKVIDCFITNFHGPKSSRIAMAAAFTGPNLLLEGYNQAIEEKYRFYEFGDTTLTI